MFSKGDAAPSHKIIELVHNLVPFFGVQMTIYLHHHALIGMPETVSHCLGADPKIDEHAGMAVAKVVQADTGRDVMAFLVVAKCVS